MPRITSNEQLLAALNWRYAVKAFDPSKKISEADWKTLEQSLVLAPSSFGLQPWKFVVVTDQATKEKLVPVSWNQTQPRDCSHLVVIAARKDLDAAYVEKYIQRTAQVRNHPASMLDGYKGMILSSVEATKGQHFDWNSRQAYIAHGFLMFAAATLGIDACPMEGINPAEYGKLLLGSDAEKYQVLCACALGYRSDADKYASAPKVRFEASELIKRV